jgi:hypothetical protein
MTRSTMRMRLLDRDGRRSFVARARRASDA